MSFERKKQLNMLDKNLDFTKSLSNKDPQMPQGAGGAPSTMGQAPGQNGPGQPGQAAGFAGQGQQMGQQYNPYQASEGSLVGEGRAAGGGQGSVQAAGGLPRGAVSQSVEGIAKRPAPRNDYDYIKMKNSAWGNKFDIISNKIKDFAK